MLCHIADDLPTQTCLAAAEEVISVMVAVRTLSRPFLESASGPADRRTPPAENRSSHLYLRPTFLDQTACSSSPRLLAEVAREASLAGAPNLAGSSGPSKTGDTRQSELAAFQPPCPCSST